MAKYSVLLLGATGETGKELFKHLLNCESVGKIILVGRRKIEFAENNDKVEQRVIDFDDLSKTPEAFQNAEIAYCCLGTTRGKAGKEGFVKVDYDYVVESARRLKEAGCKDFHLLTSKGSNANAYFLYPQIKGKCEEAVKGLNFDRVSVYRPGLLLCDRVEQRGGEKALRWLSGWVDRSQNFSITTDLLGKAMLVNSLKKLEGSKAETLEHGDILKMAKEA